MTSGEFDIGLHLMDRQLLDRNGRRCGNVDDLAIEGGPGDTPEIVALLVGPGEWGQRAGWIGRLAGWIGGRGKARIPWSEVDGVDAAVHLKRDAAALGLGSVDDRLRPYLERIPGARR